MSEPSQIIRKKLDDQMRQARRDRDEPTKNVIMMLKSKVLMELKSGSNRQEDDALWLEVIQAYAKQVRKAITEFEKAGKQGQTLLEEAQFELAFCERFLPKKLGLAETRQVVTKLASQQKITEKKQMGRLMGLVLKQHKEQVDPQLVRQAAEELLS